jgi:hypothetical protein
MKFIYCKAIYLSLIFIFFFFTDSKAQINNKAAAVSKFQTGVEVQWYPAGWLIGPVANYFISPKHILNFRAAINIADRHNWSGLNDDERGTGYGGSVGYRYLFTPAKNSFLIGTRVDLFNTKIKWKNNIGTAQQTSGTTTTLVLQPSVELGYRIKLKNQKWNILFAGGIGEEINVRTKGRDVGQGSMWLLSISILHSL